MTNRPAANKYCLLRYDHAVRSAVNLRLKQSGKTVTQVAEETGIGRTQLAKYLSGSVTKSVTQWQLLSLCNYFGIEVSINVKMT
jgi:transcriptional regulator with XRE-family HTH domain